MRSGRNTRLRLGTGVVVGAAALVAGLVQPAAAAGQQEAVAAGKPTGVKTVSTGWTMPWGTDWLPGGKSALVTERDSFKVYKATPAGARTVVGTVPYTRTTDAEGGLMGVAVDPRYKTNKYVYFMHTSTDGTRIARMTYDGTSLTGYKTLVRGIKKAIVHNGGRLAFGPDEYLYAATGDATETSLSQDRKSLNGKILRLTRDGKPAPGNPFGTLVYSLGHRNPQGLAFDTKGRLWSAELGESSRDELNLIKPGRNYGWPICEGRCAKAGMTDPKKTWKVSVASPSGIAIVDNAVYMASLRGERLWRIPIDPKNESVGAATSHYRGTYGRLRTVTKVPGSDQLWLSTSNADAWGGRPAGSDRILRVTIG
ncbi:PQQ-dependent sugar dehydrogenase [Streptomyces sp. NPDC020965]|uniref:PQQ-dependent sugar dehydrogenase n=1 Tax=Streptomyces sp. NPDC020965 TaxID=3365105 RepID=UPI0037A84EC8